MKKRLFSYLLILCLMLTLPVLADERTADSYYYGGTCQDTIYDVTLLSDGNLLLNGYTMLGRNGQEALDTGRRESRAWLLCVNPSGEIVWEVIDETEGTTRYITPLLTSTGELAVLFYNSPSQVNTEIAIHIFSQDGQLLRKVPLPLEAGLVEGRMTDGFVFYDYEKSYSVADLTGQMRGLDIAKADRINPSNTASMIPYGDGWLVAGRSRNEDAGDAIGHFDKDGKIVWYFTTPELAQGNFTGFQLQEDGSIIYNWYRMNYETGEVLESRMICLDPNGTLLWQLDIPSKVCGDFAMTDEGFYFSSSKMEKTYTYITFTLVGMDGQVKQQWQAEKRQDMLFGSEMFLWNGEAWFHADAERQSKRINDRQDDLDLQDAMLIRVKDCQVVEK